MLADRSFPIVFILIAILSRIPWQLCVCALVFVLAEGTTFSPAQSQRLPFSALQNVPFTFTKCAAFFLFLVRISVFLFVCRILTELPCPLLWRCRSFISWPSACKHLRKFPASLTFRFNFPAIRHLYTQRYFGKLKTVKLDKRNTTKREFAIIPLIQR